MALLEKEVIRFVESLDDYENVSVSDMGGWGPDGFWVVVTDERFGISYEIASHCDYWDFLGCFAAGSSGRRSRTRSRPGACSTEQPPPRSNEGLGGPWVRGSRD